MKRFSLSRPAFLVVSGTFLLQFGGCLGPNPGFFLGTSVVNATIGAIVNRILNGILGPV